MPSREDVINALAMNAKIPDPDQPTQCRLCECPLDTRKGSNISEADSSLCNECSTELEADTGLTNELLKAKHLNQALDFVHKAMGVQPSPSAHMQALSGRWQDWLAEGSAPFRAQVARSANYVQFEKALHDAMHAAFLAGALATEKIGRGR
jgi:hypothetical protein